MALFSKLLKKKDTAEKTAEAVAINAVAGEIYCPIEGNVISRKDIPDETFAAGVLGEGFGIEPAKGVVVAPVSGTVATVAETKHLVAITTDDGAEVLVHVGIDTVTMNGKGFAPKVAEGDTVKAGQVILTFSIDEIKKAGFSTTTACLLCNSDEYSAIEIVKTGAAAMGDKIVSYR